MKGSYLLVLEIEKERLIKIGSLGEIFFNTGYYVYVGSALNGLNQRIKRHLRKKKKIHWHIDYLLNYAKIIDVFIKEEDNKEECYIAQVFMQNLPFVSGFGCSDCTCSSHLFYGYLDIIFKTVKMLDMKRFYANA